MTEPRTPEPSEPDVQADDSAAAADTIDVSGSAAPPPPTGNDDPPSTGSDPTSPASDDPAPPPPASDDVPSTGTDPTSPASADPGPPPPATSDPAPSTGDNEPASPPTGEATSTTPLGGPPPADPPPPGPPPPDPPPPDPPPPGPPPSEPHRRLTRRTDDRVLCGVASGLGDYFNVDPAMFRLAFVALTFFGGSGVMLYILGWLFLPDRSTGKSVGEDAVRRLGGTQPVAIWIVVALVVLQFLESVEAFGGGLLWGALLIGAGVLYFRQDESSAARAAKPHSPTAGPTTTPPPAAVAEPGAAPLSEQRPVAPPVTPHKPRFHAPDDWRPTPILPPSEPPPPPSLLGRITVAAALIVVGLVALADNLAWFDVSVDRYAALATIVVGAGLIVGARLGRSRGLIVLGVALVTVMALGAALNSIIFSNGFGERTWQPQTVAELRDRYELGMGQLVIDLTELSLEPGDHVSVNGTIGVGQLVVDLPPDTSVDMAATSDLGSVEALDRQSSGTDAEVAFARDGPEGSPTIALDLTAGIGDIEVNQPTTSPAATPNRGN